MATRQFRLVLVTAPDLKTARDLAGGALKARLAACVNLVPGVESHYWWRGKIEIGTEILLVLKTTAARLDELEELITAEHPYDLPEFVVVDIDRGSKDYLEWVADSVGGGLKGKRRKRREGQKGRGPG